MTNTTKDTQLAKCFLAFCSPTVVAPIVEKLTN